MKTQIPIYAKVIGWFFLNLIVLGAVAYFMVQQHFGWGSDWLLTPESKTRIRSMLTALRGDLDGQSQDQWNAVIARYSAAYHMKFGLVFNQTAEHLAGEDLELPPEVKTAITSRPTNPDLHPERRRGPEPPIFDLLDPSPFPPPPPGREGGGRPPHREGEGAPPHELADAARQANSDIVTTKNPKRYWLLMRGIPFEKSLGRAPQPTTLVAMTESLSQSSLLFDPAPWLYAAGGLFLFSVIFWLPLVRSLTQATKQMTEATERIASGDFDIQVNERRRDELGRLGAAINRMAGRLSGFVGGQKRFLGDIAHELCSPLARMEMAVGVIEQRAPAELAERITDVQDEVREMRELVNELLNFSKAGLQGQETPLETLNLRRIAQAVADRDGAGATLRVDVPDDLAVLGSKTMLTRAISNVVRNAIRYAGSAGPVTLSGRGDRDRVILTVTDEGPGVPPEALPQIFDAFYRPDTARNRGTGGAGLGLAIVKTCVEACRGTVTARNREQGGLEVRLDLQRGSS